MIARQPIRKLGRHERFVMPALWTDRRGHIVEAICAALRYRHAGDEQAAADMGGLDAVVCSAGLVRPGGILETSPDDWQIMFDVNVMGVVNGINALLPAMMDADKPAHIVNTGSVGSLVSAPGMAQYTATKMAVRGISESLAFDLAARESKVRVSLLCPGPVLTSISDPLMGIEATDHVVAPDDHRRLLNQPQALGHRHRLAHTP